MDTNLKILIVDDNLQNLSALTSILERDDLTIIQANNGKDAIKIASSDSIALIILDVQMPCLDGYETARILQSFESTRHIPVIFVTAFSKSPEDVLKGFEEGAVDYLFKPLDPQLTRAKVDVFLKMYQQRIVLQNSLTSQEFGKDHIYIKKDSKFIRINYSSILYIEAFGDYCILHTETEKLPTLTTVKKLMLKLPENFARVHRSYVVNLDHVSIIHESVLQINEKLIQIGKSYSHELLEKLPRL